MKYFSPAILDGSVTTAKLADGAVVRAKISTSTASQSGNIGIQSRVTVNLSNHTFLHDTEGEQSAVVTLNMTMCADFIAVPAPNANNPAFDLLNEDTGAARDYGVAWRFINV